MATLFDTESKAATAAKKPDLWNLYLIEKHGLPADWQWYFVSRHEMPPGYFRIKGAVPSSYKKSGRPVWGKASKATEKGFFIHEPEHDAWVAEWEAANDSCRHCFGSGRKLNGVSCDRHTGSVTTTYRPCPCGREPQGPMEETKECSNG